MHALDEILVQPGDPIREAPAVKTCQKGAKSLGQADSKEVVEAVMDLLSIAA